MDFFELFSHFPIVFTIPRAAMRLLQSACAVFTNHRRSDLVRFRPSKNALCDHDNSTPRSQLQLPGQSISTSQTTPQSAASRGRSHSLPAMLKRITSKLKSLFLRPPKTPPPMLKGSSQLLQSLQEELELLPVNGPLLSVFKAQSTVPSKLALASISMSRKTALQLGECGHLSGSTNRRKHARTIKSVSPRASAKARTRGIFKAPIGELKTY